ncbi:MAG: GntR family transcriptional regulator [Syntrophales bacterium]
MFSEEVQRVYEEIKNGILDETYSPGQALPEIPLAQRYGVKRTRIRQIFQKLERDTLVEIIPARGAFVKPISMIEFQEIFEVREALEGIAARLAARKRRDDDVERIIGEFAALKDDRSGENLERKVRLGGTLHEFILRSAANRKIIAILEPLQMQVRRIWNRGILLSPERINKAFNEHIEILKVLRAKDEATAERRMQEHIANAFKDYIRVLMLNE